MKSPQAGGVGRGTIEKWGFSARPWPPFPVTAASPVMVARLATVASVWSLAAAAIAAGVGDGARGLEPPTPVLGFLRQHCATCHAGDAPAGGLDLETLGFNPADPAGDRPWARVMERVAAGEMPPAEAEQPPPEAAAEFRERAETWLLAAIADRDATWGRVRARRLSRRELERSLQAVLGIDIPLAQLVPEESRPGGYSTVAARQTMSHHQLERHLAVVDAALEEAFRRALGPDDAERRDFNAAGICRVDPQVRCREPELLRGQAVVWSNGTIYYGRVPATAADADGWYRFRLTVSALNPPDTGGVWATVHTGLCVSSAPLLEFVTAFEAQAEPREIEFEAWLPRRHMLEVRPGDITLRQAKFAGGQIGTGEGEPQRVPGIAVERLSMERIHRGPGAAAVRRLVLGDVPVETAAGAAARGRAAPSVPEADLERLIAALARRAYRRPLKSDDVAGAVSLARQVFAADADFEHALRAGYRAVLCGPQFLYLAEEAGPLDDHALAARLSYFLTGGREFVVGRAGSAAATRCGAKLIGSSQGPAARRSCAISPPSGSISIRSTSPSRIASSTKTSTPSSSGRCSPRRTSFSGRCSARIGRCPGLPTPMSRISTAAWPATTRSRTWSVTR